MIRPLRWAIVLVDFDPAVGHDDAGQRRALVVSYESFHASGMVRVPDLGSTVEVSRENAMTSRASC